MHLPVLLHETIEGLSIKEGGTFVDCTTNRGGHSIEIAKVLGKKGTLVCIDLDSQALKEAKAKLSKIKNAPTMHFIQSNFRFIKDILKKLKILKVDGVLADLGLSSEELDNSGRGFTFQKDEPLSMRFDASKKGEVTAADIVNTWSESSIADILFGFADEKYGRRIAHFIVGAREVKSISTTAELVDIISLAVPNAYKHRKTHFATKTFQALRMAVNDEVGSIKDLIDTLPSIIAPSGRACVITFHSTEDRIVKQKLKACADTLKKITKKVIVPNREEIKLNPRARSAKLRIVEKI